MGTAMGYVPPGACPEGALSAPSPGVDGKVGSVMGGHGLVGRGGWTTGQWEETPGLSPLGSGGRRVEAGEQRRG